MLHQVGVSFDLKDSSSIHCKFSHTVQITRHLGANVHSDAFFKPYSKDRIFFMMEGSVRLSVVRMYQHQNFRANCYKFWYAYQPALRF